MSLGNLHIPGYWNAASNSPKLVSGRGFDGRGYIVKTGGTTSLDGNAAWNVNDLVVFIKDQWVKISGAGKDVVSAADWLIGVSGVANVTAALQAAINATCNQGKALFLPPSLGDLSVLPLTIDARNGGAIYAIPGTVRLVAAAANEQILTIINAQLSYPVKAFYVDGLGFHGGGFANGQAIHVDDAMLLTIKNIRTYNIDYAGVFYATLDPNNHLSTAGAFAINIDQVMQYGRGSWVFSGNESDTDHPKLLFDINISNVNHFSNGLNSDTGATGAGWVAAWWNFSQCISVNMNNIYTNSLDGQAIGVAILHHNEGIFINNMVLGYAATGILMAQAGGISQPAWIYLNNVGIDQSTIIGIDAQASVLKITNTNVTNFAPRYIVGTTGPAIAIRASTADWALTNVHLTTNNLGGLLVESGASSGSVSQSRILGNNVQNVAGVYDVNVVTTRPTDPVFGKGNFLGTVATAGMNITGGESSRFWSLNRNRQQTTASGVQTLNSYTVPANVLPVNAVMRIKASGYFGADGTSKTVGISFDGANAAVITGTYNGASWGIELEVSPVGALAWVTGMTKVGTTVSYFELSPMSLNVALGWVIQLYGNGTATAEILNDLFQVEVVN